MTKLLAAFLVLASVQCGRRQTEAKPNGSPSGPGSTQAVTAAKPGATVSAQSRPLEHEPVSAAPAVSAAPSGLSIETLHVRQSKSAKQASPGLDELSCSVDAEYPAVQGLGGAVEARINALLRPKGRLLEPDCDVATSYELRYQVMLNEAGYLSVVFDGNWCCGAHPAFSKHFVNLRVRDGQMLTLANLLRPGAGKAIGLALVPLARQALRDADAEADEPEEWLAELTRNPSDFSLDPGGLRFSLFNAAPHVVQAAFEDGFLFSCRNLEAVALHPGPLDGLCASARP